MPKTKSKTTTPQVRINITAEIQEVIDLIRSRYHLLSDSEIFKLALSDFYSNLKLEPSAEDEDLVLLRQ